MVVISLPPSLHPSLPPVYLTFKASPKQNFLDRTLLGGLPVLRNLIARINLPGFHKLITIVTWEVFLSRRPLLACNSAVQFLALVQAINKVGRWWGKWDPKAVKWTDTSMASREVIRSTK